MKSLFIVVVMVLISGVATAEPRPYFTEPSLSPDRKEIAFVSGGDIWTVPATGGVASLLVSHPANEARPLYSPDGRQLAFVSTRTGNGDIYLLTLATGELKRLTFDDVNDQLDGWSRDGKWIYFTSRAAPRWRSAPTASPASFSLLHRLMERRLSLRREASPQGSGGAKVTAI